MFTRFLTQLAPEEEAFVGTMLSDTKALPLLSIARERIPYIVNTARHWGRSGAIVLSPDNDLTQGFAILQPLEWDTKQLGMKCARLQAFWAGVEHEEIASKAPLLAAMLRTCVEDSEIRLVDFKLPTDHLYIARFLELIDFHLVDILATIHTVITSDDKSSVQTVRIAGDEDVEPLKQLSREAYGDLDAIQDRFYLEPSIGRDRANELFATWFENSYKKQVAGRGAVLVFDEGDGPLGYLAIERIPEGILPNGWYDSLNAVAPEARGRGVYKALLAATKNYLAENGATDLITKTQISNQRVINSWLHQGANIIESVATFHWTKQL
jgi:GNAT superfamily N-acetyltransferase